jgi:hypothetical protein
MAWSRGEVLVRCVDPPEPMLPVLYDSTTTCLALLTDPHSCSPPLRRVLLVELLANQVAVNADS